MKTLLPFLIVAGLLGSPAVLAQTVAYKPPTGYTLQSPDDYDEYKPDIIRTVTWLETTPINKEPDKRREATRFLFQWISGAPDVSVQMQKYVADLTAQEPELLLLFMGGWARYQIQHPEVKDPVLLNTEAIKTLLNGYQKGGIKRNQQLDKLVDMNTKDTLSVWIKKQLAS